MSILKHGQKAQQEYAYVPIDSSSISVLLKYSFLDETLDIAQTIWYKIEEISTDGTSTFYGPLKVESAGTIPDHFKERLPDNAAFIRGGKK